MLPLLFLLAGCGILPRSGKSASRLQTTATSVSATPSAVPMLKIVTPTPGTPIPLTTTAAGSPATSANNSGTTTYVVQPGDTLDGIAAEHNVSVKTLEQMNGITNPADLQAGQVIKIPRTP
ncbi:MAG TPA: LysM peptidoglycan-binding domain-containing protein [Thermomicrobiaceae bacterium]|nr:LysM peptidoglycan-binding domain-containing protein [Thermomicrobiaceae bacterium]